MRARLTREFDFHAAHHLPLFPEGHKCRGLHGHTFRCEVQVEGHVDPELGVVVDFDDIKAAVGPVESQLDHAVLNDLPGLEQPTTEFLAKWIYDRVKSALPGLTRVKVWETPRNAVEYWGDQGSG